MNVIQAIKMYIIKMTEESGPGMKVILMDKETTSIVSMVFSQSEILQKEVYLFERIDNHTKWDNLKHMKCIAFLRPTSENIALLSRELKCPKYGVYFIYFSNVIAKADVKTLAECDEQESVREVQEVFADYLAVDPHLFSFNIVGCLHGRSWNQIHLQRVSQGLLAVLLSLKKRPIVRYEGGSEACARLAERVRDLVRREAALFDNNVPVNGDSPPQLLILDRRDDPVTPLLTQWTYQAMVHELLTINNSRVSLAHVPDVPKDFREVVLSSQHDDFYAKNLYSNFGEIGQTMKALMEEFQRKAKSHQKVESIADMKNFVETYPLFKKMSGTVTKHVSVVSELSNAVARRKLLVASELEQQLACGGDHPKQLQQLKTLLADKEMGEGELARLVALYGLRYEKHAGAELPSLVEALKARSADAARDAVLVLEHCGAHARQSDLFGLQDAAKITKRLFKGLKGVENIYTQHSPLLRDTLEEALRGRLREQHYPTLGGAAPQARPQDLIVFIVGGCTYEEALCVQQLRRAHPARVLLGGTTVHNSASFLQEVRTAMQGQHRTHTRHIRNI
ncbi:vacuolar protein sorting-associated protein 45 [Aricia agestis]|uniref:vacuolar protein sorting-associated protein 45 n=1 Tax=Aricia agestis TaxID=91739 RepID=UPI001C207B09|nr:vacuolar protein sorting-associated protein 45 [Aricia agestis]